MEIMNLQKWNIYCISIPVYNLEESKNFYNHILNFSPCTKQVSKKKDEFFVQGGNIKLRLYKLKMDLNKHNIPQSRRTFITIVLCDIDKIIYNLKKNNVNFKKIHCKYNSFAYSILIQEPSLNFIELIDIKFVKNVFCTNFANYIAEWEIIFSSVEKSQKVVRARSKHRKIMISS